MRTYTLPVVLLALAAARASGGGIDYEIRSGVVHQVDTDAAKIVFTVSGPCAVYLQAPDRGDKANRVETALKECAVTITKEAFERSGEAKLMTWAECQRSAKALAGKTAFMQLSGGATLDHSRIVSIRVAGTCIFRPESKPSR
jgi:hypothetical protein